MLNTLAFVILGADKALPPRQVVEAMDRYYQAVLADFSLTKPKKYEIIEPGKPPKIVTSRFFGGSRMARITLVEGGHGDLGTLLGHLSERTKAFKSLEGWREWVYLVGNKTSVLSSETATVSKSIGWGAILRDVKQDEYPNESLALALAKGYLSKGIVSPTRRGEWHYDVRPVKIEDRRCLTCHESSRIGSNAAVIVYALHRDPRPRMMRIPDRRPVSKSRGSEGPE